MARKIKQFRYYQENDETLRRNYPYKIVEEVNGAGEVTGRVWKSLINKSNLQNGAIFSDYMPAIQIGIQTIPGVKFNLNNSYSPITIGLTGIYELNVDNFTEITSIQFEKESLDLIDNNEETYLFIDIIYEGED